MLVRSGDRARRMVSVGPSFPILGYDDLTAGQVKSRLGDLSKPELRQVMTYERAHANRKSVTGALRKGGRMMCSARGAPVAPAMLAVCGDDRNQAAPPPAG